MKKERWKTIKLIADRALSMDNADRRREYLKQVCDRPQPYQEVSELIGAIKKAEESGFME